MTFDTVHIVRRYRARRIFLRINSICTVRNTCFTEHHILLTVRCGAFFFFKSRFLFLESYGAVRCGFVMQNCTLNRTVHFKALENSNFKPMGSLVRGFQWARPIAGGNYSKTQKSGDSIENPLLNLPTNLRVGLTWAQGDHESAVWILKLYILRCARNVWNAGQLAMFFAREAVFFQHCSLLTRVQYGWMAKKRTWSWSHCW